MAQHYTAVGIILGSIFFLLSGLFEFDDRQASTRRTQRMEMLPQIHQLITI
jgi:hypothetical protein